MESIFLNIAGFVIRINFQKAELSPRELLIDEIINRYRGFILPQEPKIVDYSLEFSKRSGLEILRSKKENKHFLNFYEDKIDRKIITYYHISIMQFHFILRNILQELLKIHGGFIIHSSSSNIHGQAYLFLGRPTAGKSTAMKLLAPQYKPLADDTAIIKKEGKKYYFYQTPFIEKEAWLKRDSTRYNLGKIFFLRKADRFKIIKIKNKELVLPLILEQLFVQEKSDIRDQTKNFLAFLASHNEFYRLYFTKNQKEMIELFEKI